MKTFKPTFEKFTEGQRALWPALAPTVGHGFVLYGGMGLSSRFGHRGSVDFDFFSSNEVDVEKLREDMPFLAQAETLQNQRGTYTVSAKVGDDDVRISFFGSLSIPRVGEPEVTDDEVCAVAALDDLAATKLSVLLKRILATDYRDVLAIVEHGLPLEQGIAAATAIYGSDILPSDILKALTYFEGGDLDKLSHAEMARLREIVRDVREIPVRTTVARELSGAKPSK